MEEKLNEIITKHEKNLVKYTQERDSRQEKMKFMFEHKFEHELAHLRTQKEAVSDMFYDYRKAIEDLRELLNGSFMPKESKCKYTNTLNDIHSKIVTYKDYWLFTEVFCFLHDNNDFCNCR